jgi:uncharacterized repeat protein (TIGR01451 family)
MKKILRHLFIVTLFIIGAVALSALLSEVRSLNNIIIEDADYVSGCSLQSVMVPSILPRIIVEYADSIFSGNLERPFVTTITGIEKSFAESSLVENIFVRKANLDDVLVSGDLNGTLDSIDLEIVSLVTGPFAGKGFFKGEWRATLEGVPYKGDMEGALFLKSSERKVYLKGSVTGDITATFDGCLTESVAGSDIYDLYQATWMIGRINTTTTSATIKLNGTLAYQSRSEFPASEIYALQMSIEGTSSGHFNCPLSIVLTHIHIANGTPYEGEGFSIISYTSNLGTGEGWTCDKLASPTTLTLKGLFTHPLYGVVSAILDTSKMPRTLHIVIERVDLGLHPFADLKARIWGPQRVSPGQTVTYTVEIRNNGLKSAENVSLALYIPHLVKYSSSSNGGLYIARSNQITWYLEYIPSKSSRLFTVTGIVEWGLPAGTVIQPVVSILEREVNVQIDPTVAITDTIIEKADNYLKMISNISNQSLSENFNIELYVASAAEKVVPVFQYSEENGEVRIYFEYTIEGGSWKKIWGVIKGTKKAYDMYKTYKDFRDIQTDLLKTEYFLEWLLLNNYISQEQYEDFSQWYEAKSIFEFASPSILKHVPVFGSYYSEMTKTIVEGMNPVFKRKLLEAMYLHSLEGGSFTENTLEEVFFKYLKERSYDASSIQSRISVAHDPNIKHGPGRYVSQGQILNYTVEYENEGEGIAFGVYFTDTLDEDLDDSTLEIGPVFSAKNGSIIAGPGIYNPATRTITWLVGEVGPGEGGYATFSIKVRNDVPEGTEIVNFATVYFPSVPEITSTNAIVSVVGQPNIAITNVSLSGFIIDRGSIMCINVTVLNKGYFSETFNLTLYANTTAIQMRNISLLPQSSNTLIFIWNTTNFAIGNYTISVHANPVTDEINTTDNTQEIFPVQVIPEFPSTTIISLFILTTLIPIVLLKNKRKTKL